MAAITAGIKALKAYPKSIIKNEPKTKRSAVSMA